MAEPQKPQDRPNLNPTPRARFQAGLGNITAHRSLLELPAFDRACDAALLEYQRHLSEQARDMNSAAGVGFRMLGAQEIIGILKTISEQPQLPAKKPDTDNLPDLSHLKKQ